MKTAPAPVEPRLTCDYCGSAVFADGTKGGGYMTEDGRWVPSWACCGTCCRKPAVPKPS